MSKMRASLIVTSVLCLTAGAALASHPVIPINHRQTNLDMSPLAVGATTNALGVVLIVDSDSATCASNIMYSAEFEVVPVGMQFSGVPNYSIPFNNGMGGNDKPDCQTLPYPPLQIMNLPGGSYHWQVREKIGNATSGWGQYMGGVTAFIINGADIKVTPPQLAFGNQLVGVASQAQNLTVLSTGMGPLNISAISISGPFSAAGLVPPVTLVPQASQQIAITFKPLMPGNASGTLTITSDAPMNKTVINLSGVGVTAAAKLDMASFDFGQVPLNVSSAPQEFTLTNTGTGDLIVTSFTPDGPFTFSNLPNTPVTLTANQSFKFTAVFKPLQVGLATGGLTIASNDPMSPTVLKLQGTGSSLGLNSLPNPLAFGPVIIPAMGNQGATKVVNLVSNINQPITISSISVPNNPDFVILNKPALPLTVPPLGMVPLTVAFNPTMHAPEQASVVITSDAPNSPISMLVTGTGVGPTISAAPPVVDFGNVNVNGNGLQILSVKNAGETVLTVKSVMVTGPNAAEFASPSSFPVKVMPGATQSIAITFVPAAMGPRTAMMALINDDPANPALAVKLQGNAVVPKIDAKPNPADFGAVLVGSSSQPVPITISNAGPGSLTISAVAVSGMDAASFTVVPPALPMVIAAGSSRALAPVFSPTVAGKADARLTLMTDDPNNLNFDVALTGSGLAAMVQLDPSSLDFGSQVVGRTSAARTITVSNGGTAALNVLSLTVTGANAGAFLLSNPPSLPQKLMPGEKTMVSLTYSPSAAQMDMGRLVVGSDDPMSPASSVTLSGTGVTTILSASPMSLDFGMIRAPGTSMSKMVTITNVGGSMLTMAAPVLGGAVPTAFSFDSTIGGMTLAPNATGTASVTFQPMTKGAMSATLTFKTNDANLPGVVVALSGVGASAKVMATPSALDYGTVAVGSTSMRKTVTLSNTSTSAFKIGSVTSDNPVFAVDGVDTTANIAPGGITTFTVAFAPSAEGSAMATLKVVLAGATDPEITIPANGTGKIAAPDAGSTVDPGQSESSCTVGGHGSRTTPALAGLALLALSLVLRRRRRR